MRILPVVFFLGIGMAINGSLRGGEDDKRSVDELIKGLADKDAAVRKKAVLALQERGSKAKAALPALKKALKDPDATVREAAGSAVKLIQAHELIENTIEIIERSAKQVKKIGDLTNEAHEIAQKNGTPLTAKALKSAYAAISDLEAIGREALAIRKRTEAIPNDFTEEQQNILKEKHRRALNSAFERLIKEREKVMAIFVDVERDHKKAAQELRDAIRKAEEPFERLAR